MEENMLIFYKFENRLQYILIADHNKKMENQSVTTSTPQQSVPSTENNLGMKMDMKQTKNPNTPDIVEDVFGSGGSSRSFNLSNSINNFAQKFYAEYKDSKSDESNLIFSPLSIHIALAMLASGATEDSDTQKELFKVLGNTFVRELEDEYLTLLYDYNKKGYSRYGSIKDTLQLANRVWMSKEGKESVKPSYGTFMKKHYATDLAQLSPIDPAKDVNEWVREKTQNKIEKLFEDLSQDTEFLLTNVIYFNDSWTTEFHPIPKDDAENNQKLNFTLHDGEVMSGGEIEWMTRSSGHFTFRKDVNIGGIKAKVISLPTEHDYDYSRRSNGRFDVVLVLPDHDSNNPGKIHDLDYYMKANNDFMDIINKELAHEKPYENDVNVYMPMFSLKGSMDVAKILKEKMDIKGIFQRGEFDKIREKGEPLRVGNILHKATIDVDEKGVEAAAATGVELVPLSAPIITGELYVNRPFMFMIRDTVKGFPIFMGKVMDPTRSE